MQRKKRTMFEMDVSKVNKEREHLDRFKIPYQITISNYTVKIETKNEIKVFATGKKSVSFFAAAAKIKADVLKCETPNIKPSQVKYFWHNESVTPENICCVDISAAYPTALLKAGYISKPTFTYLMKQHKLDRLGAIGMLASKKNWFEIIGGEILDSDFFINPLQNFFWYCVAEINNLMHEVMLLAKEQMLFFWVDGIFFNDPDGKLTKAVMSYLNGFGYQSKIDVITEFSVEKRTGCTYVEFKKNGEPKFLNLPDKPTVLREALTQAVLGHNERAAQKERDKKTKKEVNRLLSTVNGKAKKQKNKTP